MRLTGSIKQYLLAAVILTSCLATVQAQTADDILDKHQKAIGGADNWDKIKTVKMVGTMSQQGMDIDITQTLVMGKAMRTDISMMGMSGFQIVTDKDGWMYMPSPMGGPAKVDTMKPEMVKAMQPQMDVKGTQLLDYKSKGTKVEYMGMDTINNTPCYKVKFTDKDGKESNSFFDAATYYLLRTENKVKNNDEEMEIVVAYSNYKKMDEGVVMPTTMNVQGAEMTFKSIELNKPVDDNIFVPIIPAK